MITARWLESAERSRREALRSEGIADSRFSRVQMWGRFTSQRSTGRMVRYAIGFSTIEAMDVATRALVAAVVNMPNSRPIFARMNENSPIWARAIPTVNAALNGYLITQTSRSATSGLPMRTTANAPVTRPGEAINARGS